MVGLLTAPRGTALYKRLDEENRLLDMVSGNNTDTVINFIPKMNQDTLISGYKNVINTIYSPNYYCKRTMTLLKNYKPAKKKILFQFADLKPLMKSVWFIGLLSKKRRYFWKPLLWTLFCRPRLLSVAVTAGIYGFHFKKVFRDF